MKKKIAALFLALTLSLCFTTTAFALTPPISPNVPSIPKITVTLPDSVKEAASKAADEYLKEHPINIDVDLPDAPSITQATFYHKSAVYNSKGRLHIRWDTVETAKSYEIKITKPDGTTKTYTSDTTFLIVYEGSDDFISECPKQWIDSTLTSASATIRSVSESGCKGLWSSEKKIGCNAWHSKI